jgi:hypothetical protein
VEVAKELGDEISQDRGTIVLVKRDLVQIAHFAHILLAVQKHELVAADLLVEELQQTLRLHREGALIFFKFMYNVWQREVNSGNSLCLITGLSYKGMLEMFHYSINKIYGNYTD